MIEFHIEYYKRGGKCVLLGLIATATFLGCTSSKAVGDANSKATQTAVSNHAAQVSDANKIDAILTKLDKKSREIKTYEAKIVYLFKQPVLESESLRNGKIYYINNEKGSKLRINFATLKQDNEPVPNYKEEYFFDGINLTRIDYKLKSVEYRQLTDSDKPLNAFDLASRYLPIIGFAKADKLREDFDISIVSESGSDAANFEQLLLVTKPQSQYRSDYSQIRFWIDKRSSMPVRMQASSPQEDIYDIRFEETKMNKELPDNIFNIEVPADFSKNVVPLKN